MEYTVSEPRQKKADSGKDFSEIFKLYQRYWYWFAISMVIMLLIGYIFSKKQVPQFKLEVKILIKETDKSNDKDLLQQLNLFSSEKIIDNEIQILRTNLLMEKVVRELKLENSFYIENQLSKLNIYSKDLPFNIVLIKGNVKSVKKSWNIQYFDESQIIFEGRKIPYNKPVSTDAGVILVTRQVGKSIVKSPLVLTFGTVESVAQNIINKLSVTSASKQSTVLIISLEDEISERGVDILDKLVKEYNQTSIDDKNKTTANTLSFIEGRLSAVALELNGVEKNVENYRSRNKILDISTQSSIFLNNVKENDALITKINLELGVLRNLEEFLQSDDATLSKLPAMQGIEDPTLLGMIQQLIEALNKRESLLRTVPQTNPLVGSLNDQIRALNSSILQTERNVRSGLIVNKKQLINQNNSFEASIKDIPAKERGLIDVMRDRDIKNNLFTFLLQKREETQISLASTVSDSKSIDRVKSSSMFYKPAKNIVYVTFFLLGILIPGIFIYFANSLSNSINGKGEIEKLTDAPIFGEINYGGVASLNALITIEQPRSIISEQIRSLRTNIEFLANDVKTKTILLTSSVSGEGKSFISLNLGASLASTGKKVVVLELDLRKPKFHFALGVENGIGLSSYLIGKNEYHEIIRSHPAESNLFYLLSGTIPPNPAELLLNGRLEKLIGELRREYDYIIMDAPPIGLLADAQILSRFSDITLYVVRFEYTRKNDINLIEDLRRKKVFKNLGVVLNCIKRTTSGYGYSYGYGYGYYQEDSAKQNWFSRLFKK